MANITVTDLRSIASAAGFDLDGHGMKSKFARFLGVNPKAVSAAIHADAVPHALAVAAVTLRDQITSGEYAAPAAAPTLTPEQAEALDPDAGKSDDEILENINKRFRLMGRLVNFVTKGAVRCAIVTGPGGIGKTYPIEQSLREYSMDHHGVSVRMVSGAISPVKFFEQLWETRGKGDVLVLDDADGAFSNPEMLNLFKAATDSKGRRVVSYLKASKVLAEAGVEPQFEYEGAIIVISNIDMKAKAEKSGHMDAVLSRGHHIDLGINTKRALSLRVNDMIVNGELLAQRFAAADMMELYDQAKEEIGQFIIDNKDAFRSLTLREAIKVAELYVACEGESDWGDMARLTLGAL